MRRMLCVAAFMATVGAATQAAAHAFLEQASPRVGSRVAVAPAELRLSFSEPLEIVFCRLTVTGPQGFGGTGQVKLAPNDPHILVAGLQKPTPAGRYDVHWRVVSADSHVTQGDFHFDVKP